MPTTQKTISQIVIFIYSVFSYLIGLVGFIFFVLFIGGWDFLPFHIDSGTVGTLSQALWINLGLVLLFGLQHSVMARPAFKQQLIKIIPKAAERSTYTLLSGGLLLMFCFFWQPIGGIVWHVELQIARIILMIGYFFGWTFAFLATFVINHFELFGLQQAYRNLVNKPEVTPKFVERFLYRVVRHPLQLGILIGLWATPTMTLTHLALAVSLTIYIFIGLYFEEKELAKTLGQPYEAYKTRVPKIISHASPTD